MTGADRTGQNRPRAARSEQKEAARALAEKEAAEARALEEKQAAAEKAMREAETEAERRKREEGEDLDQERRHRRERKEAEHDAELRELYKGSQAPAPETLPPELENYLNALDRSIAAGLGLPTLYDACMVSEENYESLNCDEGLLLVALPKFQKASLDALQLDRIVEEIAPGIYPELTETAEHDELEKAGDASGKTGAEIEAANEILEDAEAAYDAADPYNDADEYATAQAAALNVLAAHRGRWRSHKSLRRRYARLRFARPADYHARGISQSAPQRRVDFAPRPEFTGAPVKPASIAGLYRAQSSRKVSQHHPNSAPVACTADFAAPS